MNCTCELLHNGLDAWLQRHGCVSQLCCDDCCTLTHTVTPRNEAFTKTSVWKYLPMSNSPSTSNIGGALHLACALQPFGGGYYFKKVWR